MDDGFSPWPAQVFVHLVSAGIVGIVLGTGFPGAEIRRRAMCLQVLRNDANAHFRGFRTFDTWRNGSSVAKVSLQ